MTAYEMGHRMLELGQPQDAAKAYAVALKEEAESLTPDQTLQAAVCVLHYGGDYKLPYRAFLRLYSDGLFQDDILQLMNTAFYEPNVREIKNRYERNCRALERYPYLFRNDFPAFEDLPIRFIPFDDQSFTPFHTADGKMGEIINIKDPTVRHYFNKNEEKPILAENIFSQYELEYLVDCVRPSEWVAKDNHIYLHYTDWGEFCSWMQIINLRPLLDSWKKIVFLIEDEIEQYPLDFKERYGIDYSQFTVRPISIREVNRMIWHTQLSTHNGGDFFNEIFDAHPNLLAMPSIMFYNVNSEIDKLREAITPARTLDDMRKVFQGKYQNIADELFAMRNVTDKDLLVVFFLLQDEWNEFVDPSCRFSPGVFFQPHFHNIVYELRSDERNRTILTAENVDEIHQSRLFSGFKYIKTFTPMRRFTTSHGGTVKAMYGFATGETKIGDEERDAQIKVVPDAVMQRVLNRSFMRDPDDRLYHDSIIVRLEDGKLNPKATFTALAEFLDLPYTESLTYCSEKGKHDPVTFAGQSVGFQTESIYKTYDDYVNDSERKYIEYFLRDAYQFYGYGFNYYDGGEVTEDTIREWVSHFDTIDSYIRKTWKRIYEGAKLNFNGEVSDEVREAAQKAVPEALMEQQLEAFKENRIRCAEMMRKDLHFVNLSGKPLELTPIVRLDLALLENPVYR